MPAKNAIPFGIVVAVARNGAIGVENRLPWRLPNDLKYFKQRTLGHPIIMGRLTYESIGRPLPGRHNIVVTRQKEWGQALISEQLSVVHSLDEALCSAQSGLNATEMPLLIGGAQLYRQALPACQTLYLTEVHADVPGDAFFPSINGVIWNELERQECPADDANEFEHAFVVLERIAVG